MPSYTSVLIPLLAASAPAAQAWGTLGHATVATVADHYLTAGAKTWVSNILGSGTTMASVASWADSYRYTSAGKFSAPYHFIDAEDSPPQSCSVDLTRDCGKGGCVVSAITNYTARVQDRSLSAENTKEALEFLIHFLGDITQPLHDEAEEVGGNDIKVTWDGTATNLHHTWDTEMVEKAAGGAFSTARTNSFAATLVNDIDSGDYADQKEGWVACVDITRASECALEWAQDANAINCGFVLVNDESGQELDGDYFTGAEPYILQQIAKGGYRLAAWINALAVAAN